MAKRNQQQKIAGMEHIPSDPVFVEKLEELRLVRTERIQLQQKEKMVVAGVLAYHRTLTNPPSVIKYLDEDDKPRVAKFKTETKVSIRSEESSEDDEGTDDDSGVSVQ